MFVALERAVAGSNWRCSSNRMQAAPRLTERYWMAMKVRDPSVADRENR
jgi:hypothetical protein